MDLDPRILLILGCMAVSGVVGAVTAAILARREAARRRRLVAVSVNRDWQPTPRRFPAFPSDLHPVISLESITEA
jgi:hypothetical protein